MVCDQRMLSAIAGEASTAGRACKNRRAKISLRAFVKNAASLIRRRSAVRGKFKIIERSITVDCKVMAIFQMDARGAHAAVSS